MDNFDKVMEFILAEEGGYVNNSADAGGETNYGISKRAYPGTDIKNLTRSQAKSIYWADYWTYIAGEQLPLSIAILMMDTAVNMGNKVAIHLLQETLKIKSDGNLGIMTLAAIKNIPSQTAFIAEFTALRFFEYTEMTQFHVFGLGWSRRVARCMAMALGI